MKILRKNLLVINKKKISNIYDLMLLLFVFSAPVLNSILFLLGLPNTSGQLAIFYIISFLVIFIVFLMLVKNKLSQFHCYFILLFLVILFSFMFVRVNHTSPNSWFLSELKLYCAMFPTIILFSIVGEMLSKTKINYKFLLFFFVFISISTFLAVVKSNGVTGGGYIKDSSGFIYQNIAYYSAYSLGMGYLLLDNCTEFNSRKLLKIIVYLIMFINVITCLISGGRGGFVLLVILSLFYSYKNYGLKGMIYIIFFFLTLVIISLFILPIVSNYLTIELNGFERLFKMVNNGLSDVGRENLYKNVFNAFLANPLFGNGIGSVFYLFNTYSHNLFIDVLCETGIVGFLVIVVLLFSTMRQLKIKYQSGNLFKFLTFVFICGFVLNMFSGYLWVNQFLWIPIVLAHTIKVEKE